MLFNPEIVGMAKGHFKIFFTFCIVLFLTIGIIKGCINGRSPNEIYPPKYSNSILYKTGAIDTAIKVAASKQYLKGPVHNFFFGTHYRDLWALPVKCEVLDIETEKGGLDILKKGGNMQTISLRLETPNKKRYVIRSIDKDQSKALPEKLKKTFISNIFRDQTSALNPYGAIIISPLAEAAKILHTNPELFVVPYDSALKEFKDEFAGTMVIMEEYPDESWVGSPTFWNADDIVESDDFIEDRFKSTRAKADIRLYARCRLFDGWINDWDRHTGQWKWAIFKSGENRIYKPIPRDRDMAFYKFDDGVLNNIALLINNKFQSFNHSYDNPSGLLKNAWYFDNLLLPELNLKDWNEIADSLSIELNDEIIRQACKEMPLAAYNMIGEKITKKLISRRSQLKWLANRYYEILNENVSLVGTDEDEKFEITRKEDFTNVKILSKGIKIYDRNFDLNTTSKISVYGLRGKDTIIVEGIAKRAADLHLYPGEGIDFVKENSNVKSWGKSTSIYDTPQNNTILFGSEGKDKTSKDAILDYDRIGVRNKKND